jgi:hypothetical protein
MFTLLYVLLVSQILPRRLLSPNIDISGDRGVRKCVFPGGRSVTYEPSPNIRKYINQYVLFSEGGEKYIKCKINEKITSIDYELIIYDRKNKPLETLRISEKIVKRGYTSCVMLPAETSYVRMEICGANDAEAKKIKTEFYKGKRVLAYAFISFALTLAEALFVNCVVIEVSDVLLGYFKCVPEVNALIPSVFTFALAAIIALWLTLVNLSKPCKILWGKRKK